MPYLVLLGLNGRVVRVMGQLQAGTVGRRDDYMPFPRSESHRFLLLRVPVHERYSLLQQNMAYSLKLLYKHRDALEPQKASSRLPTKASGPLIPHGHMFGN